MSPDDDTPHEVDGVISPVSGSSQQMRVLGECYSTDSSQQSFVGLSHNNEVSSSFDTKEFELIEKLAAEFSLDSNDSLYQQLVFKQEVVEGEALQIPLEQQRKLEDIVTQLEKDAADIERAKELLSKEKARLEEEKQDLEKASAEFCILREQKLKSIEREKAFVRRQTNVLKSRESDLVSLLRQQIADLQGEVCDKEAKLSVFRSKTRLLESDLRQSKDECAALKLKFRGLEESTTRLEQENSQLRVKLGKTLSRKPQASSSDLATKQPSKTAAALKSAQRRGDDSTERSGEKCVRFLVPEEDPVFTETKDRAVQADRLSQNVTTPENRVLSPVFVNEPIQPVSLPLALADPTAQFSKNFERVRPDGSTESIYKNGTVQEISANGQVVTYHYANGDTRRFLADGSEVYYFGAKELTQTKYPSGVIVVKYKDGREETHYPDSKVDVRSPDGLHISLTPDGRRTELYPDGTLVEKTPDGVERREFPNGDVKFKYADGTEETRYASGRVRVKSCNGSILRDEILTT
ncbi:unnamed protein product [Soboliphyme baturini]|uniref:Tcp10_C domain-containing protein n=1 Tax=Soboliphyme baturini TaxID=241478 RepID=A0A183ID45_9BILA|nr:unnamed protein product [Soboliphyme baturini]